MRVQVQIDYQLNIGTSASLGDPLPEQCNVSHRDLLTRSKAFKGYKGFHFAANSDQKTIKADGSYKFYPDSGYQGFIAKSFTDANGNRNLTVHLQFTGEAPKQLLFQFDSVDNTYPLKMTLTIASSSLRKIVDVNKPTIMVDVSELTLVANDRVSIAFSKWNKANYTAKIVSMSVNYTGIYDLQNLIDVRCSENAFDSQLNINPGIVEQYADVSIYDRDQLIHQFAQAELLKENQQVTILSIDDENNTSEILGKYRVDEWQVEATSSIVKINCTDPSSTFENIYIPSAPVKTRTVDSLLSFLFGYIQNYTFTYIDSATQTACENIKIPSSWCLKGNVLEVLRKICEVGQLRIYWFINVFIVARCY